MSSSVTNPFLSSPVVQQPAPLPLPHLLNPTTHPLLSPPHHISARATASASVRVPVPASSCLLLISLLFCCSSRFRCSVVPLHILPLVFPPAHRRSSCCSSLRTSRCSSSCLSRRLTEIDTRTNCHSKVDLFPLSRPAAHPAAPPAAALPAALPVAHPASAALLSRCTSCRSFSRQLTAALHAAHPCAHPAAHPAACCPAAQPAACFPAAPPCACCCKLLPQTCCLKQHAASLNLLITPPQCVFRSSHSYCSAAHCQAAPPTAPCCTARSPPSRCPLHCPESLLADASSCLSSHCIRCCRSAAFHHLPAALIIIPDLAVVANCC